MKSLLQMKGIETPQVEEVIFEENEETQAEQLLEQLGNEQKKDFPIVFVRGIPIGTTKDLEEWVSNSQKIDNLVENVSRPPSETENSMMVSTELNSSQDGLTANHQKVSHFEPNSSVHGIDSSNDGNYSKQEVGLVGFALETGLRYVKGVSNTISNYLSWNSVGNKMVNPPKEYKDEKGISYVEFEVTQVNWYWRQQKRILRFASDKFFRLNPETRELRAVHKYSSIEKINRNANDMTLYYNDNSQPEYYQSNDLNSILFVLNSKTALNHITIPVYLS